MRFYPLVLILFTANVMAQQHQPEPTGQATCQRPTGDLKAALDLSDSQIAALEALKTQRHDAQAPIVKQLREKWRTLNEALKTGQTDPAALGQMLLDIEHLRVQRRDNDAHYDEQALAVLTTDQQDKLKKLRMALKLHPAARQAVWLGLLDGPKIMRRGEEAEDPDPDSAVS